MEWLKMRVLRSPSGSAGSLLAARQAGAPPLGGCTQRRGHGHSEPSLRMQPFLLLGFCRHRELLLRCEFRVLRWEHNPRCLLATHSGRKQRDDVLVDRRLQEYVLFLDSAVDDANGRVRSEPAAVIVSRVLIRGVAGHAAAAAQYHPAQPPRKCTDD